MPADISIGVNNGARAVLYLNRQLQALPPMRPLILAVKAFLCHHKQNEVQFCSFTFSTDQQQVSNPRHSIQQALLLHKAALSASCC